MEAIHDVVEELSEAREERHERIRGIVTILLLAVTLLVAVTALLAGLANRQASRDQEGRSVHAAEAQRAGQHEAQLATSLGGLGFTATEARVRADLASRLAATALPAYKTQLTAEASAWEAVATRALAADPATDPMYLFRQFEPASVAQQEAFASEEASIQWSRREDADVAVAALLAVALLLLGVALSVPQSTVKWGFVAIACLLAVVAGVRLLLVNGPPVKHRSDAAISAYADGTVNRQAGHDAAAAVDFTRATTIDRHYAGAWAALGSALGAAYGDRRHLEAAVTAYRRALALGSRDTSMLNDLAYADVRLGRLTDASRYIGETLQGAAPAPPPYAFTTAVEVALARGDAVAASRFRDAAIAAVARKDAALRDAFFSSWRRDQGQLAGVVPAARLDQFFAGLKDTEASIDAFGGTGPRPLHGASLTAVALHEDPGTLLYSISAVGLHEGDVLSIRLYRDGTYDAYSSLPAVPIGASDGPNLTESAPAEPGQVHIEVYLNGHLELQTDAQVH